MVGLETEDEDIIDAIMNDGIELFFDQESDRRKGDIALVYIRGVAHLSSIVEVIDSNTVAIQA